MKRKSSTQSTTLKIPTEKLNLGMFVSQLDRPWLDTPFLFQGFPIEDEDDLVALRNICEYVYIDALKSAYLPDSSRSRPLADVDKIYHYTITTDVEKEIKTASKAFKSSLSGVRDILNAVASRESIDTEALRVHVKECVDSIERNPSALMWLTRIKHVDQYTAEHCVNVGILAIALGRHMGVGRKHMELLGLCGILHDVGKMRVDQDILNKPGRLTQEEYDHIKLHTVWGQEVLKEDESLPSEVIAAVLSHHERLDNQGYPNGIDANYLSFYTKVVTVVDAFDAMTSRRCYSHGKTSAEALKILYQNTKTQFDPKLVVKFIECVGIYPPGALVEMTSGEIGIVLSVDPANRLLPKVALLLNAEKQPSQQRVIDLKAQRNDDSSTQMRIKTVLMDGSYSINLEEFTRLHINLQA